MGKKLFLLDFSVEPGGMRKSQFVVVDNFNTLIKELKTQCYDKDAFANNQDCKLHILYKTNIQKHPEAKEDLEFHIENNLRKNKKKSAIKLVKYFLQKGKFWKVKNTFSIDNCFDIKQKAQNEEDDEFDSGIKSVTLSLSNIKKLKKDLNKYELFTRYHKRRILIYDKKHIDPSDPLDLTLNVLEDIS